MARALTQAIQDQIDAKALQVIFTCLINGIDVTQYLLSWNTSFDKKFGSATANFRLNNNDARFNEGGAQTLYVGDVVELIERYDGDSTEFKKFYGVITRRGISKKADTRDIQIQCLDYISILSNWNLNLTVEGVREKVTNEELSPVYLPAPQDNMAQLFNFANNAIANHPMPTIRIQDRNHEDRNDDQWDGFQIYYDVGQMKLGSPLNVLDNYLVNSTYYHYTRGLHIEDVIETILSTEDGYGNFLFGEASAQAVIDNHLTETYQNAEGPVSDTLVSNLVDFEAIIEQPLSQAYSPTVVETTTLAQDYYVDQETYDSTVMYLTDTSGFSEPASASSEEATIGAYTVTYTGLGSGNTLTGVEVGPIEHNFKAGVTITHDTGITSSLLYLDSVEGLPVPGSGEEIQVEINGDITTYTGISTASGGGYVLEGIPTTGDYSLSAKPAGSYVQYIDTYSAGTLWALSYNNVISDMDTADLNFPSGYSGTVVYFDKRLGRFILSEAIPNPESVTVTTDTDYSFKTLQATGVQINRKVFREREIDNRFDGIKFLRKYLAPNYIIRTQGDNKILASYLTQKSVADYELTLTAGLDYMEDEDLYTRVKIWTQNENPTNIMFGDGVDYDVDESTEEAYTGIATKEELMYIGDEKSGALSADAHALLTEAELMPGGDPVMDVVNFLKETYIDKSFASESATGYRVYGTPISDDHGKIILGDITPVVWLNGVPIDNKVHPIEGVPVKVKQTVKTITSGGGKSKSVSVHTYYYYTVIFPHTSIEPTQEINLYNSQGLLEYTVAPGDPNMDYGSGVWTIPGIEQNNVAEILSTASYWVLYDATKVEIDYENVVFKIDRSLIPQADEVVVRATFEYWAIAIGVRDIEAVVDGRRDTQLQLEFFGEPLAGFHLSTIDLGQLYDIQAVDIIGGFFKPDDTRKFDVDFTVSMQYSLDGVEFYAISEQTEQFNVQGGQSITFEEDALGAGLQARYLKFNLYDVQRIPYGKGRYVCAITEISVYNDIVLEGEARLIATSTASSPISFGDTEVYLVNAGNFEEPGSGESLTAYIDGTDYFTYTGIESGNVLTGCVIGTGISYPAGIMVTQELENSTDIYDPDDLLSKLGDRLDKENFVNDRNLYSQDETNALAKAYLTEFYKEHTKIKVSVLYSPYLMVGQTVSLTDPFNNVNNVNYFIESVNERSGGLTALVLARYPATP